MPAPAMPDVECGGDGAPVAARGACAITHSQVLAAVRDCGAPATGVASLKTPSTGSFGSLMGEVRRRTWTLQPDAWSTDMLSVCAATSPAAVAVAAVCAMHETTQEAFRGKFPSMRVPLRRVSLGCLAYTAVVVLFAALMCFVSLVVFEQEGRTPHLSEVVAAAMEELPEEWHAHTARAGDDSVADGVANAVIEHGLGEFGVAAPPTTRRAALVSAGERRVVSFKVDRARGSASRYTPCRDGDSDCLRVELLRVAIGDGTDIVVAVPDSRITVPAVARKLEDKLREFYGSWCAYHRNEFMAIAAGVALVVFVSCVALHVFVLHPLRRVGRLLTRLSNLDFPRPLREQRDTCCASRGAPRRFSRIYEVGSLQQALDRLEFRMEVISRYIPPTVARSILRGDERSSRLHVAERNVTIMFSDIEDFTRMCESLSQRDFLFVVTRYLSVMTHVVEAYDGIVSEILGDGVLAFWNTPDDVADHESKACLAALAMQQALVLLNEQFEALPSLPRLAVRIGIHTGSVLSGTIGCERRMKFGCMGDSINLASRLEGLCKVYGSSIIVSKSTKEQLPSRAFAVRILDVVQVKGKTVPTEIYELIAHADDDACEPWKPSADGAPCAAELSAQSGCLPEDVQKRVEQAQEYERALTAYRQGNFLECRQRVVALLEVSPDDVASKRLLDRASAHLAEDGRVVGLSEDELRAWCGVERMTEK